MYEVRPIKYYLIDEDEMWIPGSCAFFFFFKIDFAVKLWNS